MNMKRINLSNKWLQIALHILIWGVVFLLPYLTYSGHPRPKPFMIPGRDQSEFFKLNLYGYFFWIGTFYLNAYLLIPKYFNRNKYLLYSSMLLSTFIFIMIIHAILFNALISDVPFILSNSIMFNVPAFLLTITVSFAFRMAADKIAADKLQMLRQEENMRTELAFLRSQISPHFILNVLNNIVALNRLKSEELEPTLMKLSGLIQYMLYETDEEKVSIKTEAEYLQSYIELQQQRFGSNLHITTNISLYNEWVEIEPMLMIPFVENAFKHGIGLIAEPSINIELTTNEKDQLFFKVENNYSPLSTEIKDKTSGIGLTNVERRLKILYGDNHSLQIKKDDHRFEIALYIKLQD